MAARSPSRSRFTPKVRRDAGADQQPSLPQLRRKRTRQPCSAVDGCGISSGRKVSFEADPKDRIWRVLKAVFTSRALEDKEEEKE